MAFTVDVSHVLKNFVSTVLLMVIDCSLETSHHLPNWYKVAADHSCAEDIRSLRLWRDRGLGL
ncbi:hypothetical protein J6590_042670, partial [Homalodisca vitripennis]